MTTKSVNERELVLGILMEVTKEGVYSHLALRGVLEKYQYLDKRERAFITKAAEGTVERMIELDYIINQFSKVKTKKMKPIILNILRSAVYQMKYMDNVPDSAVCNEAVKLAVKKGFGSLRGFVNGVLRSISRNLDQIQYPSEETLEGLSVKWSIPEWIISQWTKEYGIETRDQMLSALYQERPITIRCNENRIRVSELKEKLEAEGVKVTVCKESTSALLISDYDYLGALPSFRDGDFQVQDLASILVAETAELQKGAYVIDVCAAPGGKALHAAQILEGTGHVEARDLTEYKTSLIRQNIERMGFINVEAVQMDATVSDPASFEKADVVIADLPCSGLGVLAKKTDLKYKMTEGQEQELVQLQREILSVVNAYVKPGGLLIYSTCTVHKAENEGNAAWFTETFPEFTMQMHRQMLPVGESDGFYLAKFRKQEEK